MMAPAGTPPGFEWNLMYYLTLLQIFIMLVAPVVILIIMMKISRKLDGLVRLLQGKSIEDLEPSLIKNRKGKPFNIGIDA